MAALPIHSVLPDLLGALRDQNSAVLIAPPGAGKTTAVAPALLDEDWCSGEVIVLSPRRVAARAAAERMAELLGEPVGQRVGYLTRLDSKRSSDTRILVMTEAIFVARLLEDQELAGVSAVLFDEAHERHLDSDLGLALALETQMVLREDLRLVVMSATLDGARFTGVLGQHTPLIESAGKAWPLDIRWLGASPEKRVDEAMASAILTAWRETEGDLLAFLPGVREIDRTADRLQERLPDAPVYALHGQVDPAEQRAAIRKDGQGRRRIVLATSIAETSLTLDGVSVVVDSGLSRRPQFDVAAGLQHLVTVRASQASAAQRAGRAARQGPGVAYRLWEEAAHPGRPAFDPPEILTSDLAPLAVTLGKWGVADPAALGWLDAPPVPAMAAARARLMQLGALDGAGRITPRGNSIARLPMDPVLAEMLLLGAERGQGRDAAYMALLLQERGLGGRSDDLAARMARLERDNSPRAKSARKLAEGWAKKAQKLVGKHDGDAIAPGLLLALALPDNIARRRGASGEHWLSVGGRGYILDPTSSLTRAEWLVIGDAQGQAKGARITSAVALDVGEVESQLEHLVESRGVLNWNDSDSRVEARLERKMGAITLATGPDPAPDAGAVLDFLLEKARQQIDRIVPADLLARAGHAGIAALEAGALCETADQWLAPLLAGRRNLDLASGKVVDAVLDLLDWDSRQALNKRAPRSFTTPAGTSHAIDYADDAGPAVEVRAQALFGLDTHPMIGQTSLLLKLTSPAGRPIQSTRDLPGFWRGSWRDVAREMKGRYPKHRWPDEPWTEKPSLKTKNAFSRGDS
ncbi:MAG: ATP-dependent helicase HrpB [Novosphingobium sp.]|nr:ATP-dependent helicase HrpB [Novosphingobium sp.]